MEHNVGIKPYDLRQLHPVFGLDEDWNNTVIYLPLALLLIKLHPVFGLDEDWNTLGLPDTKDNRRCIQSSGWMRIGTVYLTNCTEKERMLHPVFGLDEDWNDQISNRINKNSWLHPVFGLDEDWNSSIDGLIIYREVASSLRAG